MFWTENFDLQEKFSNKFLQNSRKKVTELNNHTFISEKSIELKNEDNLKDHN